MKEHESIPNYNVGEPIEKDHNKPWWNLTEKRDQLLIAVIGAVVGSAVTVLVGLAHPLIHWVQGQQREPTTVVITSPQDQEPEATNKFGAAGYVTNPPNANDFSLWLVVYSAGGYYPYGELRIDHGQWLVPEGKICTAEGAQDIVIYEVPNSDAGKLFDYVNNGQDNNLVGSLAGGMPPSAVLMAESHVEVAPAVTPGC